MKRVFPVDLGRPHGLEVRASPDFGALLDKVWAELREEVLRTMWEETGEGKRE